MTHHHYRIDWERGETAIIPSDTMRPTDRAAGLTIFHRVRLQLCQFPTGEEHCVGPDELISDCCSVCGAPPPNVFI